MTAPAATRTATLEQCDNGWVLTFWTRDRSDMTQRREVFTADGQLFQRIREVFGRSAPNPPATNTGD